MFRKNLFLLALCQGLMLSGTSLIMTSSALVGVLLAPDSSYATLPLGVTFVCMMLTTIPASLLMQRFGRRTGFTLGGTAGLTAGVVCAIAILEDSFVFFCLGSGCYGVASGFAQFYRFAAAEVVDKSYKSRAISWVLAGGLVAAFVGPNVARVTRDIIPGALFSASYACVALFSLGVIVTQFYLRIPLPAREESADPVRSLNSILTQPVFLVAVLCAMIAYSTMNLLMVATPLAMDAKTLSMRFFSSVTSARVLRTFSKSLAFSMAIAA